MKFDVAVGFDANERKLAQAADHVMLAVKALSTVDNDNLQIMLEVLAGQLRRIVGQVIGSGMADSDEVAYTMLDQEVSLQEALKQHSISTLQSVFGA